jgi:hypothetical protein
MCPEWTERKWLAALDDFRNWLIREARWLGRCVVARVFRHYGLARVFFGKVSVLPRSSEAMKTIGILIRVVWLAVCVAALVLAFKGYDGSSEWRVEGGRGESIIFGTPPSL